MDDIKNVNPEGLAEDGLDEPEGNEPKIYDADYVKKLKAEAKEYRQSKAALKKEYEEIKAKLDALEAEKLSDAEKKELKIKEYEAQLAELSKSAKEKEIDNLILKSVVGKNFVDIDTVSLLIKKELEAEEEINDKTVAKVVDNLIKSKPFLVASTSVNPSDGNFPKNRQENKTANQMLAEILRGRK